MNVKHENAKKTIQLTYKKTKKLKFSIHTFLKYLYFYSNYIFTEYSNTYFKYFSKQVSELE